MGYTDRKLQLSHYKDSLVFSEVISCSAIMLKYKGKFIGESQLDDSWYVGTGKSKIICISFNGDQDVSELFKFQGDFTIIGIKIVTQDLNLIECLYEKLDIDLFSRSKESFENGGSYFGDYDSTHERIDTIDETDIYKNNLFTKENEFFFENGDNYFCAYHQHSNGQAMSESWHTNDSVHIYRKDEKNKLYKPKPKRLQIISLSDELGIKRDLDEGHKGKAYKPDTSPAGRSPGGGAGGGGGTGGY